MNKPMLEKIKAAGVVGAGGAGFPTHQKLAASVDTVLVNGAECEPLLRVDQQLMEIMAGEVVIGLEAVMSITQAKQGVVALKAKYKGAIAALKAAMGDKPLKLHILDDIYPAGDEHVAVYEAAGKLVPQGGLPLAAGCVVVNPETLINIAAALKDLPTTMTYLTVAGQVPNPVTLPLPIGTSVRDALHIGGCRDSAGLAVIEGGPMMGKALDSLDSPITKTTKGLIVLPQDHPLIKKRRLPVEVSLRQAKSCCIRCRRCTDLCPRYLLGHRLEPHKIMMALASGQNQGEYAKMALNCSECGLCEQYACIMGLSPRKLNSALKQHLSQHNLKAPLPPAPQKSSGLRPYLRVPVKRLTARLGLSRYDTPSPFFNPGFTPDKVELRLRQHVGAPSLPIVKEGQSVQTGQLIAVIPDNALGANLHASITGIVTEVTDCYISIRNAVCEASPSALSNLRQLTSQPKGGDAN